MIDITTIFGTKAIDEAWKGWQVYAVDVFKQNLREVAKKAPPDKFLSQCKDPSVWEKV